MENKAVLVAMCIFLPVFLLLAGYKIVLGFTSLTPAQESVFGFVEGKGKLQAGFTEPEISHLQDVKEVMKYTNYLFYALLLIICMVILTYYQKNKDFVLKLFDYGGKTTLITMLLFFLLTFFFFNEVFTLFHILFFSQGNWVFAAESLLIQTFPLEFFIGISRNIFVVALVLGLLTIVAERVMRK